MTSEASWTEALALLRWMGENGLQPDAFRFCAVQAQCDRAGQWRRAGLFLQRMVAASTEPGAVAYGTATSGCRQDGRWPAALALLKELALLHGEVSDIALNTGLAACSYGHSWDSWRQALQLLRPATNGGDPKQSSTAVNTAAKACETRLHWDLVLELLQVLGRNAWEGDVFSCSTAVSACGRKQHWEASLVVWQTFRDRRVQPNAVAYGAVCSACSLGRPELCGDFLKDMHRRRFRPNLIVCNVALSSFVELDRWPDALQLLAEMDAAGPTPNTVSLRAVAAALAVQREGSLLRGARPLLHRLSGAVQRLLQPLQRGAAAKSAKRKEERPARSTFSSFAPLSSSVEAAEVLAEHGALACGVSLALRRSLRPSHKALLRVAVEGALATILQPLGQLDKSLESLFGLGVQGTQLALRELSALGLRAASWEPAARHRSRRNQLDLPVGTRPAAQTTLAWRAACMEGNAGVRRPLLRRAGAAVRYGAAASALLVPIRVEHDRALHPERRALAALLAELVAAQGAMLDV